MKAVASKLCKNKVGIDLVEIATNTEERMKEKDNSFDSLYGFKRTLEVTRNGIQKIADRKAVVIMVDELDRCLPEYTIKVSERLHHIFTDLKNVIVIVSMDKTNFTDISGNYKFMYSNRKDTKCRGDIWEIQSI